MSNGKVKLFNKQKGYGFIVYDGKKDIVGHLNYDLGGIDSLQENDEVEFDVAEGKKGLQAVKVKKV